MKNPENPTGQLQWRRNDEGNLELFVSEPWTFNWVKYDQVPGFTRDGAIGSKGFKAFCVWLEQGYKSIPLRDCDR